MTNSECHSDCLTCFSRVRVSNMWIIIDVAESTIRYDTVFFIEKCYITI